MCIRDSLNVDLSAKRFELLSELVPQARVIGLLVNPNYSGVERITREVQEAARAKGVQLHVLKAATESEIDAAFASLVQLQAGALVIQADSFFGSRADQLVALASYHAVPAIYYFREFAASGGLISYGTSRRCHVADRRAEDTNNWTRLQAAATAACQCAIASALRVRKVDREMRWRCR